MASTGSDTRRRSRYGCRNCKLRKLKCDEGKPQCRRCTSFGVRCNFISNVTDFQPISAGRMLVRGSPSSAVWTSDASTFYQLNARCQDFVTRYLGRGLPNPNDPRMVHVNNKLLGLAFSYPFLMHASLGVALTYERHLNGAFHSRRTVEECYHWTRATTLLNRCLQKPIGGREKDPIWGTAAALVILTFSSPDVATPAQAWPLKSSGPSDLDWLRMNDSKMALWDLLDPLRPDSLFCVMAPTFAQMQLSTPERGIDGISRELAAVCRLDDESSVETNFYFLAAHAVSQTLSIPDGAFRTGHAQLFLGTIHGPFKHLLQAREPTALILLYLWYRKTSRSIWWIELRARVECPAIRLYLQRFHGNNNSVQAVLQEGLFRETVQT